MSVVGLAISSILVSGLPVFSQCILFFILLISVSYWSYRDLLQLSKASVVGLRWMADQKLIDIQYSDLSWDRVSLIEQRFSSPLLLALKVRTEDRYLSQVVLIWRDSIEADQFRRMKTLVRYAPGPVYSSGSGLSATHN